ncbi:carbohydrate-binding protein [Agaribacterium sp. ZY112]|uniref:carbohydrate-binding protein n=1 Tax=Agaribacterium sp. ZY112 TaxID=3233574 RepID=UPI0035265D50
MKKMLSISTKLMLLILTVSAAHAMALRVGDPGVSFDTSKYDSDYPEMLEWQKAGVQGGIPWLSQSVIKKTINPTDSDGLNAAISEVANAGGGQLRLRNGIYTINKAVNMKKGVRVVGESRSGVKLNITMQGSSGIAISFNVHNAGLENLTVQGAYGTPNDFEMIDAKSDFLITSINFGSSSKNSWLDKVSIINSGNSAISSWNAKHITIRDCYVERSWNKGGGGHGYVALQGSYMLMTGCQVKKMRHISIQKQYAKYNVIYDNDFDQEVSFHVGDAGYNLVENNRITLPSGLDDGWHAIMTPWSYKHAGPGPKNAVYKNQCVENNNGGIRSFSDPNIVYVPEDHYQVFTESHNTPTGGSFYPIQLGDNGTCESTELKPYVKVDNESWQQHSQLSVEQGQTIQFGPHPTTGGSWQWSGCGISASAATERHVSIQASNSCRATATYTNDCGTESALDFDVVVNKPSGQHAYKQHSIPGRIEVEDFDLGGGDVAYKDSGNGNNGNSYRESEHVDIQATSDSDGDYNVGWIADGEWLEYSIAASNSGNYDIQLRVAVSGASASKAVMVRLDNELLGQFTLASTGGWQNWQTLKLENVSIKAGVNQVLRLEMLGGNFNLNWIDFKASTNAGESASFTIEAEDFSSTGGAYGGFDVYRTANGVDAINFNQRGDWVEYQVQVPASASYRMEAWLGTTQSGGAIEVLVNGTSYLKESVSNNGDWDNFVKLSPNNLIPLDAGQNTIRIQSSGNSSSTWEWNADKFYFIAD